MRLLCATEVERQFDVPLEEQAAVVTLLEAALARAGLAELPAQHVLVVDRSPQVQAALRLLRTPQGGWRWVGASPVSTGRVGSFDHFRTPLGVFAHSLDNRDFRAEGTFNSNGIRGYGVRGMRVFDFGWVLAERGWGAGGSSPMRLQMHATDPAWLEPRLGRADSKGCIRIPVTLNTFLDRYGVLDADYEAGLAQGKALWMLRADRTPLPWPGRWLVVVDSLASSGRHGRRCRSRGPRVRHAPRPQPGHPLRFARPRLRAVLADPGAPQALRVRAHNDALRH